MAAINNATPLGAILSWRGPPLERRSCQPVSFHNPRPSAPADVCPVYVPSPATLYIRHFRYSTRAGGIHCSVSAATLDPYSHLIWIRVINY